MIREARTKRRNVIFFREVKAFDRLANIPGLASKRAICLQIRDSSELGFDETMLIK